MKFFLGMDGDRVKARDKQQSLAVCRMFPGKSALGTIEIVSEWLRGLTKELQKRLIEDQLQVHF